MSDRDVYDQLIVLNRHMAGIRNYLYWIGCVLTVAACFGIGKLLSS